MFRHSPPSAPNRLLIVKTGPPVPVFVKIAPSLIQPTSLGRLSRMVGPTLEGAEPGEYEIELNLKDELSGKILDRKEDFTVTPKPDVVVGPSAN